jgi:hypothetical protein
MGSCQSCQQNDTKNLDFDHHDDFKDFAVVEAQDARSKVTSPNDVVPSLLTGGGCADIVKLGSRGRVDEATVAKAVQACIVDGFATPRQRFEHRPSVGTWLMAFPVTKSLQVTQVTAVSAEVQSEMAIPKSFEHMPSVGTWLQATPPAKVAEVLECSTGTLLDDETDKASLVADIRQDIGACDDPEKGKEAVFVTDENKAVATCTFQVDTSPIPWTQLPSVGTWIHVRKHH